MPIFWHKRYNFYAFVILCEILHLSTQLVELFWIWIKMSKRTHLFFLIFSVFSLVNTHGSIIDLLPKTWNKLKLTHFFKKIPSFFYRYSVYRRMKSKKAQKHIWAFGLYIVNEWNGHGSPLIMERFNFCGSWVKAWVTDNGRNQVNWTSFCQKSQGWSPFYRHQSHKV